MTSTSSVTATAGSAILTSLGAGSGIDSSALIGQLVAANKANKQDAITTRSNANTAKISALATIKNGVDTFTSALETLTGSGQLMTQPTSSDESVASLSAISGAQVGDLSGTLEVVKLAKAQTNQSDPVITDPTAAIGQGAMTLTTPAGTATITIGSGNDSLKGLAAAINAATIGGAKTGVTASVVQDGTGYRLVLKGQTGAANGFSLAPDSGAAAGLSTYSTASMIQVQPGSDAELKLDGVSVTRPTNTIDDLVGGAKIVLKGEGTIALGSSRPTDAIKEAMSAFVTAYNSLRTAINATTAAATATSDAGAFNGNPSIRQLQQMLAKLTSTKLSGAGSISTLAEIGIKTTTDGTLTLDSNKLANILTSDPDGVEALFNPGQRSSSGLLSITSALGATKAGTYTVTNVTPQNGSTPASGTIDGTAANANGNTLSAAFGTPSYGLFLSASGSVASATITIDLGLFGAMKAIQSTLEATTGTLTTISSSLTKEAGNITTATEKMNSASDVYEAQLTKQFTAMQTAVSSYKSIQSYLTQQVALWTKSS